MSLFGEPMWTRRELADAIADEDALYLVEGRPVDDEEGEDVGAARSRSPKEIMHGFFGEVIKGARARREMTCEQLAKAIGRSAGEVSSWETGRRPVSERVMLLVADAMGCTLAKLFAEELSTRAAYKARTGEPLRRGPSGAGFLGECVRQARTREEMTQRELGARMSPPVQQPQILTWENSADGSMGEASFVRLARAFGQSEGDFIARELIARGEIERR